MKIISVKLEQDCNSQKFYELVVEIDSELPEIPCKCIHITEDGDKLWYGENADGFVSYYSNGVEICGHDADYMWSSRSGIFNALGKKCMDIVLIEKHGWRMSFSMTVDKVTELLPDGYEIAIREEYCWGNEIAYSIIRKEVR